MTTLVLSFLLLIFRSHFLFWLEERFLALLVFSAGLGEAAAEDVHVADEDVVIAAVTSVDV
jgi:hypothetical protein